MQSRRWKQPCSVSNRARASAGIRRHNAIEACATIITTAPVDDRTREQWLGRLREAHQNDAIPFIEGMADYWGELCASRERASAWADRLIGTVESTWIPSRKPGGHFHGTIACLSALFHAGRHEELLALLDKAPHSMWHYREWGVKALTAVGRKAEAIRYAEASRGLNDDPVAVARACEETLLSSGLADEAFARYAIAANQGTTFLATFRAIAKKYPTQAPAKTLADLVASTPGQEGKCFAAAKDAGLYDEAIALARRRPCDPLTLTRAARDFAVTQPRFAVEAGLAALHWTTAGYGYEMTGPTCTPRARAPWLPRGTADGSMKSRGGSARWLPVRDRPPRTSSPRRWEHERSRDLRTGACEGHSTTRVLRSHPSHQ